MGAATSAKDLMTRRVVTFSPCMDVTEAIHQLVEHGISGAPVIDDRGRPVGILTERDCLEAFLRASYHAELVGPVSEFMSRQVRSVDAETSLMELADLFVNSKFRRYPVLEEGRLVGLISRRDVLKALLKLS